MSIFIKGAMTGNLAITFYRLFTDKPIDVPRLVVSFLATTAILLLIELILYIVGKMCARNEAES